MRMRSVIVVGVLLGLALVARDAGAQTKKFPAGTTVTILASSSHTQLNGVFDAIGEIEKSQGIKVVVVKAPVVEIVPKTARDIQLGTGQFDLIDFTDQGILNLHDLFEPLDAKLKADNTNIDQWKGQFAPWLKDTFVFNTQVKYWPYYLTAIGAMYRKGLLEDPKEKATFKQKFGYDLPTPPKSPKEVTDVAVHFTRKTGGQELYGLTMPGSGNPAVDIFHMNLFKAGLPGVFDEKGDLYWGKNHPENKEAVLRVAQYLYNLANGVKVTPPGIAAMGTTENLKFYLDGKAAMLFDLIHNGWKDVTSQAVISRLGETASFEVPGFKPGEGGIVFYWHWAMSKSSKNKDAAWEVMKWLNTEKTLQLALTGGIGVFVPSNTAVAQWAAQQRLLPPAVVSQVANGKPYRVPKAWSVYYATVAREQISQLTGGSISPEQFVKNTAEQGDRVAEENK